MAVTDRSWHGWRANKRACLCWFEWMEDSTEWKTKKIIRHPEAGISRPCPMRSICCEVTLKSPPFLLRSDLVFYLPQRAERNVGLTRAIFENFMVGKTARFYCIFSYNYQSELNWWSPWISSLKALCHFSIEKRIAMRMKLRKWIGENTFKTKAIQKVGTCDIALCIQGQRTEDIVLILLLQVFQKSCWLSTNF